MTRRSQALQVDPAPVALHCLVSASATATTNKKIVLRLITEILFYSPTRRTKWASPRRAPRLSRAKILEIKDNPSGFYVNVYNRPFPNGAMRGQLSPAGM